MTARKNGSNGIIVAAASASAPIELTCGVQDVDAAMAKHLRASCHFERQRTLSEQNIKRLAGEMERGWFVPGTPITLAVLPGRSMLLLNGNHTLEAIMLSNTVIPLTFIYVPVANVEEAGHLYARMDLQKLRSWSDAYRAVGVEPNFNSMWMGAYGAALRIILAQFKPSIRSNHAAMRSRESVLYLIDQYMPYAEMYVGCLATREAGDARYFRRSPVFAVALELMKYQPVKAAEFFSGASGDNGLLKGDPRKAFLNYLRSNGASSTPQITDTIRATVRSWNAFYSERELERVNTGAGTTDSFRLLGTPWEAAYVPPEVTVHAPLAPSVKKREVKLFSTGTQTVARGDVRLVTTFEGVQAVA